MSGRNGRPLAALRGWKAPWGEASLSALLARSLANMEAVFGQIFPATFVARLVALHLAPQTFPASHAAANKRIEQKVPAGGSSKNACNFC